MAFEGLSEKLNSVFKGLRGKGRLTEEDIKLAMREVRMALLEADVSYKVVKDFVAKVSERAVGAEVLDSLTPAQQVIKIVNEELTALMGGANARLTFANNPPTVVMMVGLQGAGKTTNVAKLAGLLRRQGKRPLLAACDVYRPAAITQLQVVGAQLGLPVFEMGQIDPVTIAVEAVKYARDHGNDIVFLDTAGRLHIDEQLMDELKRVKAAVKPNEILLVVDAMTGQDAVNAATAFDEALGIDGVVLTKLDGDARGGAALSIRAATGKPIKYIGTGEKLDMLEPFHPDRMASRILGMGDVLSLIEKAEQHVDEEKAKKLEEKLKKNRFTLTDYYEQLVQLRGMGDLSQLAEMMPGGMGKQLAGAEIDPKVMAHTEAIILSMTPEERENPKLLGASRKKRVAAGCGLEVVDVNRLLKQFEMMQDLVKQMTRGRMPKGLGGFGGKRPNLPAGRKGAGIGMSVIVGLAVLAWGATGFYIVPEGQSGIVTTFGRYAETTAAGFRWHLPMPIQDVQIVDVSSVRTTEIGFAGRSDRLREALMLTDDENIVDVQFTVQYRIKPGDGARDYVFRIRQPDLTVTQAAESAMREVVGRKAMDSVLFESKAEIAEAVKKSMQDMLDRYSSGIEVMSVAIQNAQPPQQVQAAFNDAVKAGQDRERSINLGEAYRNAVIPKAEGTAARLKEEALGYQARIVETARGDADRFSALQSQYARAPEVTRDRLYVDTVRDVMKNVTKVYVDAKGGNNLLYLPLDKIVNNTKSDAMTQAQKEAAALADHGVTAAQSAVETTGSAQPTTSSAAPGDEYQRMLRDRR